MASREADSRKIVERCVAVEEMGWKVRDTTDGWRIEAPNGETFAVHKTLSDWRAFRNTVVEMENKGGLKKDEATLKARKLGERRKKLANQRAAADAKGAAMAAKATANNEAMIQKAAGPYLTQVEETDLQWLTTPHPSPWMRWMYIDGKTAEHILENCNDENRPLSEAQAKKYATIILSKQWHLTHQGLAFDTRGIVQDAQHRLRGIVLAALVEPDIRVPFPVFVGMPIENFKAIDEGRLRTAAQMLSKAGLPGGTHLVTIMRGVAAFESDNPRGYNKGSKFTQIMAWNKYEEDPDLWRDSYTLGHRAHRASGKVLPLGAMGAAHYLLRRSNGRDNIYVTAFFEGLIANRKWRTQMVLPDEDPRNVLLTRFRTSRPAPGGNAVIEGVFWVIASWNNFVRGHHPMYLRFTDRTPPPELLVCKPGHGEAPRALAGELAGLEEEAGALVAA